MATARVAAALTRPVLAVPGPVTSPASAGCHRMIREGEALLAGDVTDVLGAVDLCELPAATPSPARSRDALPLRERRVLDALPTRGIIGLDALLRAAGLPMADVLAAAGMLVAAGWAEEVADGWRLVRAPRA
jgi:DNA processing protein